MKLSKSAKARLERQQREHIAALEKRLVTCDLSDFAAVEAKLIQARADLQTLASIETSKPTQ